LKLYASLIICLLLNYCQNKLSSNIGEEEKEQKKKLRLENLKKQKKTIFDNCVIAKLPNNAIKELRLSVLRQCERMSK
tara:strand:+ start:857 stop:1090 length:234 start_codon:yes stop_codon:yes gene_type:complete